MSDDKKTANLSWLLNFRICIIYEKIISRVSKDNATSNKNEKGHDFQCSITYFCPCTIGQDFCVPLSLSSR